MATKAQKRAAAEKKRAEFEAEVRASGLRAQEADRARRKPKEPTKTKEELDREILDEVALIEKDLLVMGIVAEIVSEEKRVPVIGIASIASNQPPFPPRRKR